MGHPSKAAESLHYCLEGHVPIQGKKLMAARCGLQFDDSVWVHWLEDHFVFFKVDGCTKAAQCRNAQQYRLSRHFVYMDLHGASSFEGEMQKGRWTCCISIVSKAEAGGSVCGVDTDRSL